MITTVEISLIDDFVLLDRQLKALKLRHEAARARIIEELGDGRHESDTYSVTVTLSQQTNVDYKTIMAAYEVPQEVIQANTKVISKITVKAGT